jgi:acetoin utilization protein AcuC
MSHNNDAMALRSGLKRHTPLFVSSEVYRQTGYGSNHPLAIQRIGTVLDLCEALGWFADAPYVASTVASIEQLTRFHSPDYVAALQEADRTGKVSTQSRRTYNIGTMENPFFPGLYRRATTSVGGSIMAAGLAGDGRTVYHPSGGTHHGVANGAKGFCYFNDVVFAILTFLDLGFERLLYLDLDAHHGDGVQSAFETDPRVLTISIHEENRWPYTGDVADTGCGHARNIPVPAGFNDSELQFVMDEAVLPMATRFAPDAVVVCCGADGLAGDPLSSLALSNVALWDGVESAVELAAPAVVVGGGGYNPWTVARCWTGLWGRLAGFEIPDRLPASARAILARLESDLIDEEDVEDSWTETLADAPNEGAVRAEVTEVVRKALKVAAHPVIDILANSNKRA